MVPRLLEHLHIPHVSLASHSGGDIYLLNTLLTYPYLLHPSNPYIAFFAPWVHPSHSEVKPMQAIQFLPGPIIGKYASAAKFINHNITPLTELSGNLAQGIMGRRSLQSLFPPAATPPTQMNTYFRAPSTRSIQGYQGPALDHPEVLTEVRKYVTMFMFAENMDGISADAQIFMKKPSSISWSSPNMIWSDIDFIVPLLSKIIDEDERLVSDSKRWVIDTFHAEQDEMVGEKGREWFDGCWLQGRSPGSSNSSRIFQQCLRRNYEYRSEIVRDTDHNFLMDPAFGASELWLQRVRDACPSTVEV
jgi:hypothetical protein